MQHSGSNAEFQAAPARSSPSAFSRHSRPHRGQPIKCASSPSSTTHCLPPSEPLGPRETPHRR
jgi:hypothetical protein